MVGKRLLSFILILFLAVLAFADDDTFTRTTGTPTIAPGSLDHDDMNLGDDYDWTGDNTHAGKETFNALVIHPPSTQTIADDGAGTSPTATLTPTSKIVEIDCLDSDGCTDDISEAGASAGQELLLLNVGSNTTTLDSIVGQMIMSSQFAMGQGGTIAFVYSATLSAWVETGRSDN